MESQLFKPTHEVFDAAGESCGLYKDCGDHMVDAHVWFTGGRPLFVKEMHEWGWKAKCLNDRFRKHYREVHGHNGSECDNGCGGF